jgi:YVTN family beta-propeller protein
MKKALITAAFLILGIAALPVLAQSHYQVVRTINLPGNGFWDYITVDESHNRIFVSHSTQVQVFDSKNGQSVGVIADTKGVHGIAIAADLNKGFTSNGQDSSLTVFNLTSLVPITKIRVNGNNPDAIMYDAFSKQVFTGNGRSASVSVIDAVNNTEKKVIAIGGKPEAIVSDGNGKIYVNVEDKSSIAVIDANTLTLIATWPIDPGEEPSGLALDNADHRLFAVCGNELMVAVDALSGKVITTLPIGEGCDGAMYDPENKRVYASNGEGTLTVVQVENANSFKVLENVPTKRGARTLALDKSSHHIFLPTAEFMETTAENERRPSLKPDSFSVLEIAPVSR